MSFNEDAPESESYLEVKGFGRRIRRVRFEPNAFDADEDGRLQDGTPFERPAGRRPRGVDRDALMSRNWWNPGKPMPQVDLDEFMDDRPRPKPRERNIDLDDIMADVERNRNPKPPNPDERNIDRLSPSESARMGPPKKVAVPNVSMRQWNELMSDVMTSFSDTTDDIEIRRQKRKAFRMIAAMRNIKITQSDDGLMLEAPGEIFELISKELKALKARSDFEIRHLDAVRDALKAGRKDLGFVELDIKIFGRRSLGRGIGSSVRRFVRGARFNPDAFDADNDGTVQEGTQFARIARSRAPKPKVSSPEALKAVRDFQPGGSVMSVVRTIDTGKALKMNKDLDDRVEKQFGKVETVGQALKAFKDTSVDIQRNFDFLQGKPDSTPLGAREQGYVYGYLDALSRNPDFKNVSIKFTRTDKDDSSQFWHPFSSRDGRRKHEKPMVEFRYRSQDTFSEQTLADFAVSGNLLMDSTATQIASASINGRSDSNALEDASRVYSKFVAMHEAGHGISYVKAYRDVFDGKTDDEIKKEALSVPAKELLQPKKVLLGIEYMREYEARKERMESLATTIRMLQTFGLDKEQIAQQIGAPNAKELSNLIASDLMFITQIDDTIEKSNRLQSMKRKLDRGKNIYKLQSLYEDDFAELAERMIDISELEAMGIPFSENFAGSGLQAWENKMMSDEAIGQAISYLHIKKFTDDLTPQEIADFWEYTKSISMYASKKRFSYYKNQYGGQPIEGIAEIAAGLEINGRPPRHPGQYAAVKKLFVWQYGLERWKEITGE